MTRICSVKGCGKPVFVKQRGWCRGHYKRWQRHGDPQAGQIRIPRGGACSIEGCSKPIRGLGMCSMHENRLRTFGDPHRGPATYIPNLCWVPGCNKNGQRTSDDRNGLCATHGARQKRNGSPFLGRTPPSIPMQFLEAVLDTETGDCIEWPFAITGGGYGNIIVEGRNAPAHREVCRRAKGEPPTSLHEAAHGCGNRRCINHRHIRWATHVENEADKVLHGSVVCGERHGLSRLTWDDVKRIRNFGKSKSQREIGEMFGVSQTTVSCILSKKTWWPEP